MPPSRTSLRDRAAADAESAAALAARIVQGDREAEEQLVERYGPGLSMLLRRHLKDSSLAEDLCQEVFRIALVALRSGELRAGTKLAAYLWAIARHVASRERRLRLRSQRTALDEVIADPTPGPEQQAIATEHARLLQEALTGLGARDRLVLEEFFIAESPKASICEQAGLTSTQFDLVKWRAIRRLKSILRSSTGRYE